MTPVALALEGRFVTPGLVDLHVHFPPRVAVGQARLWSLLFLAHGVTSVRELGTIDGSVFEVREAIADGAFPGPRVFACGEVIDGDPPSFPSNRVVGTPEEARRAVAEQHARGARCIKVYNALGAAELAAVLEEAARRGLPLVGHKPHDVLLEDAGVSELQHGTGIPLVDKERVGLEDFRFQDWAEMDDARVELGGRDADSGLPHLPRFWEGVWATLWSPPWTPGDSAGRAVFERFRERQREVARRLVLSGVELRAGTDTLMPYVAPGSSLHGELHELAGVGLGPAGVWRAATARAGRALGVEGLGRIAVGAPAGRDGPEG